MKQIRCIYCLADKPQSDFTSREHIMPQSFGHFKNNLTLLKTVCNECNQYFGDNIELYLGRDTFEGIMRYGHGIKPEKIPQKHRRLKFRIPEGKLKNLIVKPKPPEEKGELDIKPVLQVGFFDKWKNEFVYYEPENIPTAKDLQNEGFDLKVKDTISLIAKDEEMDDLLKLLNKKGFGVELGKDESWPVFVENRSKVKVEATVRIDRIIYRGISKIGFNYLALAAGEGFALSDNFNGIRNFIRYDVGQSEDYFIPNQPPILHDDKIFNVKTTQGHLIILERRGNKVISKVSLFNLYTYLIILCKHYSGIWFKLSSGHHFDVNSRDVSKLKMVSKRFLV
jgi:hypothetical protein